MTANHQATHSPSAEQAAHTPPPVQANDAKAKWKKQAWIGGGAVVILAGVLLSVSSGKEEKPAAPVDVPHLEGKRIVFSAAFAKRIGLASSEVKIGQLTPVISVIGNVALDPEYVAAVGTRMRGLVRSVHKFEGDEVKKGDLLAQVDSAELGEAQAAVTTLRAEREAADLNSKREERLLEQQLSTAREAEVAQSTLKKYDAMLHAASQRVSALGGSNQGALGQHGMVAPIDGTVVERFLSTGQSVEANLVAFKIANLDHLWVELAVFEKNLGGIRIDDQVEIGLLSDPEVTIAGRVAHIGAQINPDTRSADVRIEIDNRSRKLRPGQAVTAEIHTQHGSNSPVLFVPSDAVTIIDGEPTVFVNDGPTSVRTVPVQLGKTNGEEQQITSGLTAGQQVVSKGVFALKSELFR